MFISVYASGTNVQRLAKCASKIDGVLYSSYAQLEKTEPDIIKRKFYCTEVDTLKTEVEKLDVEVMPSWNKIWGKPLANMAFVSELFKSLVGDNTLRTELNLSHMADAPVYCFMLLVSANKKEMGQIAQIARRTIPDYHIKVLNGDFTDNKHAESETAREINEARIAGKIGVIIIANQMGSRSYSVPEIQATVIAFDRGGIDATQQKVSRCLTPGPIYDGSAKEYGLIVDLSFDPNRAENIELIVLQDALQVQLSGQAATFSDAVKYVLSSVNLFKMNEYGHPVEVSEEDMFRVFGDNEAMLRVADISVDITAAIESGMFDILCSVTTGGKGATDKKDIVGDGVKNSVTVGTPAAGNKLQKDPNTKKMQEILNDAIRALNMSATSVYHLSKLSGNSYRECMLYIEKRAPESAEFIEFFGISASDVIKLLNKRILNEAILDVIVQNSKPQTVDFLF